MEGRRQSVLVVKALLSHRSFSTVALTSLPNGLDGRPRLPSAQRRPTNSGSEIDSRERGIRSKALGTRESTGKRTLISGSGPTCYRKHLLSVLSDSA